MSSEFRAGILALFALSAAAQQAPIDGDWAGTLQTGSTELRLIFHFRSEGVNLVARMDVPDQGAVGIPVSSASFNDRQLKFEVSNLGITYEGKQEGARISGTFTQRGAKLPLILERTVPEGPAKKRSNEESWAGDATAPNGSVMRILVKTWAEEDGSRHASMESPGQALAPIPVTGLVQTGEEFKFQLRAFATTYEGKFSPDHNSIDGKLTQGGVSVPLVLRKTAAAAPAAPVKSGTRTIDGIWEGTLTAGVNKIRLTMKIRKDPSGVLTGTLDSIDANLADVPLSDVTFKENLYAHVEIKRMAATYDAKLGDDGVSMNGTWTQGAGSVPLAMVHVDKETEVRRPQMPQPPFPYSAEEVNFANPKAEGVLLSGTLTIPKGTGPFPAALLITGSGPQDRDEAIMGHKPFFVIADSLTRRGIAVLRVDDRGVGKSTGRFNTATSADFATDAEAGIAFLKSRKEIDSAKIGVIGHSEGGLIGPMIAARNPEIAFVVMLAGPGVSGSEILISQVKALTEKSGAPPEMVVKAEQDQRKVMDIVVKEGDPAKAEQQITAIVGQNPQIKMMLSPWYRYFAAYDPKYALEKLKQPVLALNGDKDTQVIADQNLDAIRAALTKAENPKFEVRKLKGLNHLFQTAQTGLPSEYGTIEETFSPDALQIIGDWIAKVTNK